MLYWLDQINEGKSFKLTVDEKEFLKLLVDTTRGPLHKLLHMHTIIAEVVGPAAPASLVAA